MKGYQIVFEQKGSAALRECGVPEVGADEVFLESDYSAVSAGTERANLLHLPNTLTGEGRSYAPGYSSCGRVAAKGRDVTNLNEGDRVLAPGAAEAFSPDEEGFVEKVKVAAGGTGPDAVVEVTGSAVALQQALEYAGWQARISLLGCTRISDVPIDLYKYVHRRGVSIVGSHTFARPKHESAPGRWTEFDDYRMFIKLLAAGKLEVRSLITQVSSPDKAADVYASLAQSEMPPLGIVFDWNLIR